MMDRPRKSGHILRPERMSPGYGVRLTRRWREVDSNPRSLSRTREVVGREFLKREVDDAIAKPCLSYESFRLVPHRGSRQACLRFFPWEARPIFRRASDASRAGRPRPSRSAAAPRPTRSSAAGPIGGATVPRRWMIRAEPRSTWAVELLAQRAGGVGEPRISSGKKITLQACSK
jgi:hypothetical protein